MTWSEVLLWICLQWSLWKGDGASTFRVFLAARMGSSWMSLMLTCPHRRIKGSLGCVQSMSRYKNEEGAKACCLSVITAKNPALELRCPGSRFTRHSGAVVRDLNSNTELPGFQSLGSHLGAVWPWADHLPSLFYRLCLHFPMTVRTEELHTAHKTWAGPGELLSFCDLPHPCVLYPHANHPEPHIQDGFSAVSLPAPHLTSSCLLETVSGPIPALDGMLLCAFITPFFFFLIEEQNLTSFIVYFTKITSLQSEKLGSYPNSATYD